MSSPFPRLKHWCRMKMKKSFIAPLFLTNILAACTNSEFEQPNASSPTFRPTTIEEVQIARDGFANSIEELLKYQASGAHGADCIDVDKVAVGVDQLACFALTFDGAKIVSRCSVVTGNCNNMDWPEEADAKFRRLKYKEIMIAKDGFEEFLKHERVVSQGTLGSACIESHTIPVGVNHLFCVAQSLAGTRMAAQCSILDGQCEWTKPPN
jgi:hypothetical protein